MEPAMMLGLLRRTDPDASLLAKWTSQSVPCMYARKERGQPLRMQRLAWLLHQLRDALRQLVAQLWTELTQALRLGHGQLLARRDALALVDDACMPMWELGYLLERFFKEPRLAQLLEQSHARPELV
ncbi:hypothetical protein [Mumia zhuanghuii]|uniref:Uncharacterized protein n=1 Tax=Mumia zhuanghuii TaxID=2585211 RepID=A0A5C4M599_9ACTN|nr:hypothetical protein [Mumia zhuanghuii]TNC28435.1 hypothetical protein FHE65_34000 [Mumia zhuanghuii]